MTSERKWADIDLEDDADIGDFSSGPSGFETAPDADGIKTITNYITSPRGETIKIVKRVQVTKRTRRINKAVYERKNLPFFGVEAENSASKAYTVRSHDEINIEVSKEAMMRAKFRDDEDDEDIQFADLNPTKTSRDLLQKFRFLQSEGDPALEGGELDSLGVKMGSVGMLARLHGSADVSKEMQMRKREEATVRVTNLSEDASEEDLMALFSEVGQIERVFLAKHKDKKASKGFAFITFQSREIAAQAIRRLNRHGFDNLVLNVEWARPSTRDR